MATRRLERFKAEHGRALALLQGQIQREQAVQSALLSDANAETQAVRQYRFDALKRLYVEVSPLLFQMREPMQQARDQVKNLARAARDGNLGVGDDSWIVRDDYYSRVTMYRLMLPAVYYRLLQRRLALVDLSLDVRVATIYALLTEYIRALRADFDLARSIYPSTQYRPDREPRSPDGSDVRQGLLAGWRDIIVDALLVKDDYGLRAKRFGEFETEVEIEYCQPPGPGTTAFQPLWTLLKGFEPKARPVLWALLVALALLSEMIDRVLSSRDITDVVALAREVAADDVLSQEFEVRGGDRSASAAREYLVRAATRARQSLAGRP
jgi:hypothetical protein